MGLPVEKWSFLAGIRFVLALVVAVTHLGYYTGLPYLALGAFEAIVGFLLISGYSIGSSYCDRPKGFYVRRVERIYPCYIAGLLLAIWAWGMPPLPIFLANLLFLTQAVTTTSFIPPVWSLSLEVWLYALTPLLAKLRTKTLWVLVTGSFLSYVVYVAMRSLLHTPYFAGLGYGANLILLSFFWIAGFILGTRERQSLTLALIALGLTAHLGIAFVIRGAYQFTHLRLDEFLTLDILQFLSRALVLSIAVGGFYLIIKGRLGTVKSHTLNVLGDVSYPLYLVHIPVYIIGLRYGVNHPVALLVLALAAAAATMIIFEYPIRQMRRKNKPRAITAAQA